MNDMIKDFRLPRYAEIPTVGLYLEQVIRYLNEKLAPLGCIDVTPSMVSNYVKKGYIARPVKKIYGEEQIAGLFFLVIAKQVLPMDSLNMLMNIQRERYSPQRAYDYFCEELERMLKSIYGQGDAVSEIEKDAAPEKKMLRSLIIAVSHSIHLTNFFRSGRFSPPVPASQARASQSQRGTASARPARIIEKRVK